MDPSEPPADIPVSSTGAGVEPSSGLARSPAGRRRWMLPSLLAVALAALGGWLALNWGVEETDNAQLDGQVTEISSRIPGTIARVLVQDNQNVRAGDVLLLLDRRDGEARLRQAEADLLAARRDAAAMVAQAGATVSTAAAASSQALSAQQAAQGEMGRAAADLRRTQALVRQGAMAAQDADRAREAFARALADHTNSQASRQTAQARRSQLGVDRQRAEAGRARVLQAQAAVAAARLTLSYDRILAPSAGRIGDLHAEPGRQVQPSQPLMTLVGPQLWVEANFKETQLGGLYPGQRAEVRLDAFPGRPFRGVVESLAPASGARFALLPPENATGNFTKVVQRVSVRIALLPQTTLTALERQQLVPGLSASVRVRRR